MSSLPKDESTPIKDLNIVRDLSLEMSDGPVKDKTIKDEIAVENEWV